MNLAVDLGNGLKLKNPVLTASGTYGYGTEYSPFVDLSRLGGIIVKGTTLEPRQGNPSPRMIETPSGMINAVGLQNKGVDHFIENRYPVCRTLGTEVIVNVSGLSIDSYVEVARRLLPLEDIHAIEVNISCPNVKAGGMAFGTTCYGAAAVTAAVRKVWNRHLMVKLSPNVTDITEIAAAVEGAGADSVSLVNTFLAMHIDVERQRPSISTITGGLSGPAIRPIAVRMVWQVAKRVHIPVVGLGGITNSDDALQFIMAGATAVQIGTYNFVDPGVTVKTIDGIRDYLLRHNIPDINNIVGLINK